MNIDNKHQIDTLEYPMWIAAVKSMDDIVWTWLQWGARRPVTRCVNSSVRRSLLDEIETKLQ
jgi:hypothetical protein